MAGIELWDAVTSALAYWPWLGLVVAAQFAHELTHFAVARALGVRARIVVSITKVMYVYYPTSWREWFLSSLGRRTTADLTHKPTRPVTALVDSAIGTAPTLAGSTTGLLFLGVYGWPAVTPTSVLAIVAWLLYTLPSRDDLSGVGELIDPDGTLDELQRSLLIGLGAIAIGMVPPLLPYPQPVAFLFTQAFAMAGVAYLAMSIYEHGGDYDHSPSPY